MRRKVLIPVLLICLITILTSCPIKGIIPGSGSLPHGVGAFDKSNNPLPLEFDIEFDNQTEDSLYLYLFTGTSGAMYGLYGALIEDMTTLTLQSNFLIRHGISVRNYSVQNNDKTEASDVPLMNSYWEGELRRVVWPGFIYDEDEDFKTIYPGVVYISLSWTDSPVDWNDKEHSSVLKKNKVWDSYNYEGDAYKELKGKNPRTLTVKDFENVGGDFYYILDPAKSGTTSFGHVVCKDVNLDGMPSGHVKIKLTIKDDPDNEGKKLVEFSYLGEVTEEE